MMTTQNHANPCSQPLDTAILLIDPKDELTPEVARMLDAAGQPERLIQPSESNRIAFFEGLAHLSTSDKFELLWKLFSVGAPRGTHTYWENLSKAFAQTVLQDCERYRDRKIQLANTGQAKGAAFTLPDEMLKRLELVRHPHEDDFWIALREVLNFARQGDKKLKRCVGVLKELGQDSLVGGCFEQALNGYTADSGLMEQFNYVMMGLDDFLLKITDPAVCGVIDFSFSPCMSDHTISVLETIETGKVLAFSPGQIALASADLLGKIIKVKYFQAAFCRQNKRRPVAYVCDEFQRFITTDEESGEQSFLDRCRAHRVMCVLATQSVAALRFAGGGGSRDNSAIDVILNNTAGKVMMRNTDPYTSSALKPLLPPAPSGHRHIVDARPLSTLDVGEAYYLLANGKWGRTHIPQYAAA